MSDRPRLVLILSLLVLLTLTLSACNRERPAPTNATTGTPAARGTVAAPSGGITQVAPTTTGAQGAAPTPAAPQSQTVVVSPAPAQTGAGQSATGQTFTYTVVAGDTLLTIATRFGTTPEAIAQLNSLADPNALTLGQKLQIPGAGATTGGAATTGAATTTGGAATTGGTTAYTVQAGDTLGVIARRFGTTVAELVRLNNLANPDALQVGQKLTVPGSGGSGGAVTVPSAGQGKTYTVQRGDTLLSIARRFGLTVKQLQAANNISNPDRIYPGQVLTIP
jgi:LysM repeat protein